MADNQLVVINSGSSSIKFAVFQFHADLPKLVTGSIDNIAISPKLTVLDQENKIIIEQTYPQSSSYEFFFELLINSFHSNRFNYQIDGVGHRIVHGGRLFYLPMLLTNKILDELKQFIPFAPLHQPYNLQAVEFITKSFPDMKQIGCFDTAFHHTHPAIADLFAIPRELTNAGIKRYGFHGLSYEYIMHRFKQLAPTLANSRIIIAHLGNGSSMCAVKNGISIDSTMGFTAVDGLVMGTRCGTIDPGVLLYLMQQKKLSAAEIESLIYKKSGLLGVSGTSSNMKTLLDTKSSEAQEAIALFVYRIKQQLGALTSIMDGLDVLIFTGGIGEHAWQIREAVCADNEWLGLSIDTQQNQRNDLQINDASSKVSVYAIPTNEEWMIAKHTYNLLAE
jgi:acetate kinase